MINSIEVSTIIFKKVASSDALHSKQGSKTTVWEITNFYFLLLIIEKWCKHEKKNLHGVKKNNSEII